MQPNKPSYFNVTSVKIIISQQVNTTASTCSSHMMRMSDNPFPLIDDGWMDNKKSLWSPLTPFLFPLPLPEGVLIFMLEGDFSAECQLCNAGTSLSWLVFDSST